MTGLISEIHKEEEGADPQSGKTTETVAVDTRLGLAHTAGSSDTRSSAPAKLKDILHIRTYVYTRLILFAV